MEKDQLTFNDLPNVVGEICDKNEKKVTVFAEVNPQNMS